MNMLIKIILKIIALQMYATKKRYTVIQIKRNFFNYQFI